MKSHESILCSTGGMQEIDVEIHRDCINARGEICFLCEMGGKTWHREN